MGATVPRPARSRHRISAGRSAEPNGSRRRKSFDDPGPLREEYRLLSAAITAADSEAAICGMR
jgi:hypothetical protein